MLRATFLAAGATLAQVGNYGGWYYSGGMVCVV
jgi:hypothetical protein